MLYWYWFTTSIFQALKYLLLGIWLDCCLVLVFSQLCTQYQSYQRLLLLEYYSSRSLFISTYPDTLKPFQTICVFLACSVTNSNIETPQRQYHIVRLSKLPDLIFFCSAVYSLSNEGRSLIELLLLLIVFLP